MENKNIEKWREDFEKLFSCQWSMDRVNGIYISSSAGIAWVVYEKARQKAQDELDHWHKVHSRIIKGLTEEKKQITASMRNEIDSLQKQLNQQDFQLGDLNYLINSLRVEIDKLEQQNKELKSEFEAVKAQLERSEEVNRFYADINNWKRSNKTLFNTIGCMDSSEEKCFEYAPINYFYNKAEVGGKRAREYFKQKEAMNKEGL